MEPLHDWLSQRGVDTGMIWGLPRWNVGLPPDGDGHSDWGAGRPPREGGVWSAAAHEKLVERKMGLCVQQVSDAPGGVARLLLVVLDEVEQAWQVSYTFDRLLGTLHGTEKCLTAVHAQHSSDDLAAEQAVRALMWSLDAQIRSEGAMTSGLLDVRADTADDAALWARRAVRLIRGVSQHFRQTHGDVVDQVMKLGRAYDSYQHTMATATRALAAFYASGASLNHAVEELRQAETDEAIVDDEGSVSLLRALRYSLLELQERAGDPWLRVGHGKLVYLYPFAVRGVEPADLVEAVGQDEAPHWELVGTRPVRAHGSLDLDDVWKSHDSLGRRYDGALVVMPDAVVCAPDGRTLARLGVQVRLSLLGNHYVRFEADLADMSAVELFAMLFWAGPEAGALNIRFDGAGGGRVGGVRGNRGRLRWPRLSDLAMDLAQDSVPAQPETERAVVCRPGLYQVVMAVTAAYTVVGPAGQERSEILTSKEFAKAGGCADPDEPGTEPDGVDGGVDPVCGGMPGVARHHGHRRGVDLADLQHHAPGVPRTASLRPGHLGVDPGVRRLPRRAARGLVHRTGQASPGCEGARGRGRRPGREGQQRCAQEALQPAGPGEAEAGPAGRRCPCEKCAAPVAVAARLAVGGGAVGGAAGGVRLPAEGR
ncbi:hypothetical protein [Kitasatospora aureofaciens]|uniref:hypothetical protein n=1 Tax=Kitasatospora aureofaciens TaxID=1894 RepID=UPI00131C283C|nr:hypothetical protein [Kitasatospora aureofaciens]